MKNKCTTNDCKECWCKKLYRGFLYALPAVLFLSYFPLIHFGNDLAMNYEISLPIVWLVLFDLVGLIALIRRRQLLNIFRDRKWVWLIFPVWVLLSIAWSANVVRGLFTGGLFAAVGFAIYIIWSLRDLFSLKTREVWWKWFLGSTLIVCVWCVLQCVLDLCGVSRDYSLMCEGCTYRSFGFPHPNGFAIEPQFMGNLLIAPALASLFFVLKDHGKQLHSRSRRLTLWVVAFVIVSTLFLTFSRGAIYAFIVGTLFLSCYMVFVARKEVWKKVLKRVGLVWGMIAAAFLLILNVQGLMAEVGPTKDTYIDGVAKVLNHLSLGVIDVRGGNPVDESAVEFELIEEEASMASVENSENVEPTGQENNESEEAIFDGYVAESTDARVMLTNVALKVWSSDSATMMFGVGLGGAGQAFYDAGQMYSPFEIVQNQYASLLLETGLIGVSLLAITAIMIVRFVVKNGGMPVVLAIIIAFSVSLCFFSGLPNALHVYLLPMVMLVMIGGGAKIAKSVASS